MLGEFPLQGVDDVCGAGPERGVGVPALGGQEVQPLRARRRLRQWRPLADQAQNLKHGTAKPVQTTAPVRCGY